MSEEKDELKGLNYEKIQLDHNAHKLVGKLTKLQSGIRKEIPIEEGATWLVTGLGYLKEETPDELIQSSLDDTIIVSKTELKRFLKDKNE